MDFGTNCWCKDIKKRILNIFAYLSFLYVAVNLFIVEPKITSWCTLPLPRWHVWHTFTQKCMDCATYRWYRDIKQRILNIFANVGFWYAAVSLFICGPKIAS
jgi:hypothetical protein